MAEVRLENICKNFDNKEILKNIDLEIKDKEFCTLVGASGCGKSTLLRIIAGLEHQDKGNVFIGDKNVNEVLPKNRDIAFVFQSYALYPHLNVFENIAYGLQIQKVPENEIKKRVVDMMDLMKITEYANLFGGGNRP